MGAPQTGCSERARLAGEVDVSLQLLIDLIAAQHKAFVAGNDAEFMRLDKELENALGSKERAIGALRQHTQEHRCR